LGHIFIANSTHLYNKDLENLLSKVNKDLENNKGVKGD